MTEYDEMCKLFIAITKNTIRPTPKEMEKIKVEKKILTSPKMEGDSKIGMILLCGMASSARISDKAIMDFACIEGEPELKYKIEEYYRMLSDDHRFQNKITLINNYLNLN